MESVKRHPNLFNKNDSALLVVDYQERFVKVLPDNKNTIENIKFLIHGFNIYNVPVFVSEQVPEKLGHTVQDIKDVVRDAFLFSKKPMSCCGNVEFLGELKKKNIKQIAVCGIEAHVCVQQTTLDLLWHGFQVHVISDAITSRVLHNKGIGIEKMRSAGAIISSVETVLFEMAYEAGNEEFKKLQQLFKNDTRQMMRDA
ncbi:MAG: isochorismatase family protein [Candidatus Melainabacteria bacterium]|nr:isochorismatase family protein [Candidatus Melainabacteria bacterium]MBI3308202.1 isochorismatase family protein [Candidatus Melainabacteria bacterium]